MTLIIALLWTLPGTAQVDKVSDLDEEVRSLLSRDRYDAAREAIRKFTSADPALAKDSRVAGLQAKADELAKEADLRFRQLLNEGSAYLSVERFSEAVRSAQSAAALYPERKKQVDELLERIRTKMPGGAMVRVPGRPVLIDVHPVTNQEYAGFVAATGAEPPRHWGGGKVPKGRERHPVIHVTWAQAEAYARWAGKRLPTADEWEAAARGDDRREYPWGNVFQEESGRLFCNSLEYWQVHKSRSPGTTPVDEFPARAASGALMGGNVWEWTSTTAAGKIGDRPAEFRVLKGGSFMTPARAVRCASALPENPALAHYDVGFRCAKDAK